MVFFSRGRNPSCRSSCSRRRPHFVGKIWRSGAPVGRSWRRVGHLRSRLMLEACGALGRAWASSPRSYVGRALGLLRRRSELEARGSWPRSSSRVGRSWSCRSLWPRMVTPSCLASGAEVLAAAVRAASRAEVGRRCLRFAPKLWALI